MDGRVDTAAARASEGTAGGGRRAGRRLRLPSRTAALAALVTLALVIVALPSAPASAAPAAGATSVEGTATTQAAADNDELEVRLSLDPEFGFELDETEDGAVPGRMPDGRVAVAIA